MWIKVRLAPMCPFLGTISLAFVGPPTIKVQLLPYNRVRLMRIPILQAFLTKLLTIDLPGSRASPRLALPPSPKTSFFPPGGRFSESRTGVQTPGLVSWTPVLSGLLLELYLCLSSPLIRLPLPNPSLEEQSLRAHLWM